MLRQRCHVISRIFIAEINNKKKAKPVGGSLVGPFPRDWPVLLVTLNWSGKAWEATVSQPIAFHVPETR